MPLWVQAGLWGLVAGSALLAGAVLGYFLRVPPRLVAGVLISALSFELMDEAYKAGGFGSTCAGFLGGAAAYTAANWALARYGAKHRKRSGTQQPSEGGDPDSGLAIAVGPLLEGCRSRSSSG